MNDCKLCIAVKDSIENGKLSLIENRLLYSTKSFIVVPTIGPLTPGHVMIISKKHYVNLSLMNKVIIEEIQEIIKKIDNNSFYENYIVAEHGAFDEDNRGGACIIHTHLHLIPMARDMVNFLDKNLDYIILPSLKKITKVDYPYILLFYNNTFKIYNSENVPTQYIRRAFYSAKGNNNNWDWRNQPKNNYNEQTIAIWEDINK